jgi:hypothetical protein
MKKRTHLYRLIPITDKARTKTQRRFALPYIILFGKGLDGDRRHTTSGKAGHPL